MEYSATRVLHDVRYCHSAWRFLLRADYATSGTNVAYPAMRAPHAMPEADADEYAGVPRSAEVVGVLVLADRSCRHTPIQACLYAAAL
eukprot:2137012-Rhodomonas_salina.2